MYPLASPYSTPLARRRGSIALRPCWRLARRTRQYLRLLVLFLTIVFTVTLGLNSSTVQERVHTAHLPWPLRRTPPPRISLIVVWTGTERLNHLTWFLDSVARQPNELELILIQRGDTFVDLKSSLEPSTRNIKLVQMSNPEYWRLHRDYLCKRWGGCTSTDEQRIDHHLGLIEANDAQSYTLSILRGEVFRKYMHSRARWWGWCDQDTVFGSFARQFPWDIAEDFDVLAPTHRNGDPNKLVYLRGHLAFFRNTPESSAKITSHPDFATMEGWLSSESFHDRYTCGSSKHTSCSPKEATYSSHLFNHPNISFLAFDALSDRHHAVITRFGVYGGAGNWQDLDDMTKIKRTLLEPKIDERIPAKPTFTPNGRVRTVDVVHGSFPGDVWFNPEHSNHYVASTDLERDFSPVDNTSVAQPPPSAYRTYLYRTGEGTTVERIEPVDAELTPEHGLIEEWLYIHFQEEKRKDWFKRIPDRWEPPHPTLPSSPSGQEDDVSEYDSPPDNTSATKMTIAGTPESGEWMLVTEGHDGGGFHEI